MFRGPQFPVELAEHALEVIGQVERALGLPPEDQVLELRGRALRHPGGLPGLDTDLVADPHVRLPDTRRPEVVRARCASRIVVLGKYARPTQVKARAYLLVDGRAATLKVWRMGAGETPLGARERRVRERVARFPQYRAPTVLRHGTVGDVDYLLEQVVYGMHPLTAPERRAAAEDLVPSLAAAYIAEGRVVSPASAVMSRDFATRLRTALDDPEIDWPCPPAQQAAVAEHLLRLVAQDRALVCALGHGDLVATNIIRTPDGSHVLVDWEHGRRMPVAFDLGKLLLTGDALEALRGAAVRSVRRLPLRDRRARRYTWDEQVLLGFCERLAAAPERRRRAAQAGRSRQFERELTAQLEVLLRLVERTTGR